MGGSRWPYGHDVRQAVPHGKPRVMAPEQAFSSQPLPGATLFSIQVSDAAHGFVTECESIVIHQGRFVGRPIRIAVTPDRRGGLWVGGPVAPVARGVVDAPGSTGSEVPSGR
jgi:hypothetical protein